jgi:hypothetical protein
MPEQFRLDQRFGHGRAIERHQRLIPAHREAVETFRDQFLARTPFTNHQNRAAQGRGATGALHRIKESARLANELRVALGVLRRQGHDFAYPCEISRRLAKITKSVNPRHHKMPEKSGFPQIGTPHATTLA